MARKRLVFSFVLVLAAAVGTTLAGEREAEACGGCFGPPPPPTESPTVVTDHRMILSVSKEQTTLYDQIRYQGSPSSFGWVLPIAGTVKVGLSADIVFQTLDGLTQTRLISPPQNCPAQPPDCNNGRNASAGAAPEADEGGVTVLKQEVVGPYQTVQLASEDPKALEKWLAENGYVVADDVKPVIAQYVAEKFNFLALKLIPGKGVQDMRPVRVTTQGASAMLPLRMVAAGTGPTVGITLWIVGEGRYEPQNFPSFYIPTDDLVWDWAQQKSNYVELRAQKTQAGGGRIWEMESSTILYRQTLEGQVRNGTWNGGQNGGAPPPQTDEERAALDYLPVKDDQGNVVKTAAQVREEDMDTLFYGIPVSTSRVTRIRADLARAALDQDLGVTASQDQSVLSNVRQLTKELNQPECPVWNGCSQEGTAPRDEAIARSRGPASDGSCATAPRAASPAWLAAGGGFAGLALIHAVRRRRERSKDRA